MAKNQQKETIIEEPVEEISTPELQQPPVITIGDLKALRDVLQIATDRKMFSIIELGVVTQLFTKLNMFVTAIDEQMAQQESQGE
jgi:hypothetical protein